MANEFFIGELFRRAFGNLRGTPYVVPAYDPQPGSPEYPGVPAIEDEEGTEFTNMRDTLKATSPLGKPLFMPMRLGGVLLPNEPTITIIGKKRIVSTPLSGSTRRGSVKELIGIDDFDITIRGVAINYESTKIYPEDLVKDLVDLFNRNESVLVESALTNLLGIYRLVIQDMTLPEMIGIQHAQAYEFKCLSDEDFTLELDE